MPEEILSYRPNSKLIKKIILFTLPVIMIMMTGNFFCVCHAAETNSNPIDETIKILERWTSSHWGQDCFVWIVHYPKELAETWAESEAIKNGMTYAEQEEFRQNFISELKLDTSETFLVSVYSFGSRPLNLSPVNEKISLLSSSGERIKPSKYDSSLDYPSAGVVQGLVFFPKQINEDYMISVKGMGRNEKLFSFSSPETPAPAKKQDKKPEVVVVNLPKKQTKQKPKNVLPPPPPQIPPRPIPPLFEETSTDMNEFINSAKTAQTVDKAKTSVKTNNNIENRKAENVGNSYSSRESVLRKFLALWANNIPDEMYGMLSETSQKMISPQNFAKEISKASDFRTGLRGDYKIDWVGEERAKIITTHKTLIFKSVSTRTLGVTREGSSWKIIW